MKIRRFKPSPDYDIPMRNIFRSQCPRFFSLIGVAGDRLLDTDVSVLRKKTIDFAVLSSEGEIHHVEFQRSDDASLSIRMLDYFGALLRLYGKRDDVAPRIRQVVVQVANKTKSGDVEANFGGASVRYRSENTLNLSASYLIDSDKAGDIVLSVMCGMKNEVLEVEQAIRKLQRIAGANFSVLLNHFLALSVATDRFDIARDTLDQMPISITVDDVPFVKEFNRRAVQVKLLNQVIEYCDKVYGRQLSDEEFARLGRMDVDEANVVFEDLWGAEDVDEVLQRHLPAPSSAASFTTRGPGD